MKLGASLNSILFMSINRSSLHTEPGTNSLWKNTFTIDFFNLHVHSGHAQKLYEHPAISG